MTKEEQKAAIRDLGREDLIDLASDSSYIIRRINGEKHLIQVDDTESKKDMKIENLESEVRTMRWVMWSLLAAVVLICTYFLKDTSPMMHWIYFVVTGVILIATLIWPSFVR